MGRRDWWKNFKSNDGRKLVWTIFWNICKNNARLLGSVVAKEWEDWELLVQQQRQRPCSEPGRRSPDVSNIATDCQKNRYPSFISCPYNLRWRAWNYVSSVWRNDALRSCPKQTVSTVCYEINTSWYPVLPKLVSYICEHWRLIAYYLYQNCGYWSVFVEVIWKYNRGPVFLNHSVVTVCLLVCPSRACF